MQSRNVYPLLVVAGEVERWAVGIPRRFLAVIRGRSLHADNDQFNQEFIYVLPPFAVEHPCTLTGQDGQERQVAFAQDDRQLHAGR